MTARSPVGYAGTRPSWRCPACGGELDEDATGAWCASGHRVDRAREGYLHLLPSGRLAGRAAGDSREMLLARRAVFDAGHYRPVQDAVAAVTGSFAPEVVLDAGCGEGTYLAAIDAPARLGIDVAKDGIRLAARRFRDLRWAVASSYRLPLADDTVDVAVSVFAPRPFPELRRVLRPGGVVVIASPGPDHLAGLTDLIYGRTRHHEQRAHNAPAATDVDDGGGDGARDGGGDSGGEGVIGPPVSRERVRFELTLTTPGDTASLLQMTPYWWSASEAQRAAIGALERLTTTVDVIVTAHPA